MLELDVKIETAELFDYRIAHTYNSSVGILGSSLGGLLVVVGLFNGRWIFLTVGVIVLLALPVTLYGKSRKQVRTSPDFQTPMHYILDDKGITVLQGTKKQHQAWENMYKAMSTSKSIIVYSSPVNATIIPRHALGENVSQCIEIISTHMPPSKVKIRY